MATVDDDAPVHRRRVAGGALRGGGPGRSARPPARRSATVAQADREDARPRGRGRAGTRSRGWAAHDRVRARRRPAPDRRRLRAPPRRAGPRADARPGQAALRRVLRRGRRAGRDVARRGRGRDPDRGRDPAQRLPRHARAAAAPPEGARRDRHAVELAVHDAGRAGRARARVAATRSCGTRRRARRSAPGLLAECVEEAELPPGVFNFAPGRGAGRRRRDRRAPATSPPSASSARPPPATGSRSAPPASRCCWRWAATARSSCSRTPTSTRPPTRRSSRASCAPARAAPRASGCSCTRRCARTSSRGWRQRAAAGSQLGDPLAEGTQMGPLNNEGVAAKMDAHVRRRRARAAPGSSPAASAPTGSRPTSTGPPRSSTACRPTRTRRSRRRSGRSRRSCRSTRSTSAIELTNASPYGLLAAIYTADLRKGLRFADEVRAGPGQHQRDDELLGEPPAVRRPRGHRQRHRARRRALSVRGPDRAADGRDRAQLSVGTGPAAGYDRPDAG